MIRKLAKSTKRYHVYACVNGKPVDIKKEFKTRWNAIDYMLRYFNNKTYSDFVIDEIIEKNKHCMEYVENNYNRFIVDRVHA